VQNAVIPAKAGIPDFKNRDKSRQHAGDSDFQEK
jgi:hypothetical protein